MKAVNEVVVKIVNSTIYMECTFLSTYMQAVRVMLPNNEF